MLIKFHGHNASSNYNSPADFTLAFENLDYIQSLVAPGMMEFSLLRFSHLSDEDRVMTSYYVYEPFNTVIESISQQIRNMGGKTNTLIAGAGRFARLIVLPDVRANNVDFDSYAFPTHNIARIAPPVPELLINAAGVELKNGAIVYTDSYTESALQDWLQNSRDIVNNELRRTNTIQRL